MSRFIQGDAQAEPDTQATKAPKAQLGQEEVKDQVLLTCPQVLGTSGH